ncbi:MAG: hypothetical protein GWN66_12865, partial [Pseudomonas stutzeri]|nr:hypothetical protein [Stutzerimonas stutzeri]
MLYAWAQVLLVANAGVAECHVQPRARGQGQTGVQVNDGTLIEADAIAAVTGNASHAQLADAKAGKSIQVV